MSDALKKITTAAKKIRRAHPSMKWASAIKQAGAQYRAGKLGAVKKKSAPKKKKAFKRTAKRKYSPAKYKSKTHTYKPAARIGAVVSKSTIKSHYRVTLGKELLARELATTKTAKKKISKKIALTKKALHFLS